MQWSEMRGFNYQPSYSAHLQYIWTGFDPVVWEREVMWSKRFGTNTLRVWLDWSAYLVLGDALLDRVETALSILDRHGIKMMPVLFNRWWDGKYPAGGVTDADLRQSSWRFEKFAPYVDALMARFGADPRIVLWDLCNEPWGADQVVEHRQHVWLANMAARVRLGSRIPLTIGSMTYDSVEHYAALVDVISFHPYPHAIGEMEGLCQHHLALARYHAKPLICNETCCGSFDDHERGRLAQDNLETLTRHGIGWTAWMLCAGKFVSGSRERVDSNSIRPNEGFMAFILGDGSTRPGHEWLEAKR